MASSVDDSKGFLELCTAIGAAICIWQDVEKAHFKLFLRMLGAPQWEVAAAVYYSIESFALRHTMVSRMAHYYMEGASFKKHREEWAGLGGGLQKELKDAGDNRNKLAHYNIDWNVTTEVTEHADGTVTVVLGPPTLQPMDTDLVARLIGRTPDKPEHNLAVEQIRKYSAEFIILAKRLDAFQKSLNLPRPQLGLAALLSGGNPMDPLWEPPPTPPIPPTKDNPSSAE
jgi:hypothetical protein